MSSLLAALRRTLRTLLDTGERSAAPQQGDVQSGVPGDMQVNRQGAATGTPAFIERRRVGHPKIDQKTLFGEILDWMFAPLMLLWPLSVAITFVVARSIADSPYDDVLSAEAHLIADQVQYFETLPILPGTVRNANADIADGPLVQILTRTGQVLAGTADLPKPPIYEFPERGATKLRNAVYRGEEIRIAYRYLYVNDDAPEPVALLQVAESGTRRVNLTNDIIKSVILPQFLIIPLAGALVWFGLGRGLAPLRKAQRQIRDRRPDDQSPIDLADVPQEVSPLVESFNDLLARLNLNISAQKRFIADAAHQIKTPLAGLRTQAELALRQTDPNEMRAAMERVVLSTDRATRLVNQLLLLARADASRATLNLEPVNLAASARHVAAEWVDRARARNIDLGFEFEVDPIYKMFGEASYDEVDYAAEYAADPTRVAMILGQPLLIEELINNLIDNALRYSPENSVVTVRVRGSGDSAELDVEDNGPGIARSEHASVFERFYRVLGSGVEGSGLGLAIVKEIAEQHQARIDLRETHPGAAAPGLRVHLDFPRLSSRTAASSEAAF